MQSDRDALLAGILADPDADLPRLVFADWLEETGHPANCARAEYIRLAIRRAELHRSGTTRVKRIDRLDAQLMVLEKMFDDGWASYTITHPVCSPRLVSYKRSRGFISGLAVCADSISPEFQQLLLSHPIVEFTVADTPPAPDRLTVVRVPITVRRLHFSYFRGGGPLLIDTLQEAVTPRLRSIIATSCGLTDAHVVRLVHTLRANPTLGGVESLTLAGNWLTDHAAHTLAAAELAPTFRCLNIEGTRITNAGREVLFRRFGFEELRPRLALS